MAVRLGKALLSKHRAVVKDLTGIPSDGYVPYIRLCKSSAAGKSPQCQKPTTWKLIWQTPFFVASRCRGQNGPS